MFSIFFSFCKLLTNFERNQTYLSTQGVSPQMKHYFSATFLCEFYILENFVANKMRCTLPTFKPAKVHIHALFSITVFGFSFFVVYYFYNQQPFRLPLTHQLFSQQNFHVRVLRTTYTIRLKHLALILQRLGTFLNPNTGIHMDSWVSIYLN